jgi:hypothetical protein
VDAYFGSGVDLVWKWRVVNRGILSAKLRLVAIEQEYRNTGIEVKVNLNGTRKYFEGYEGIKR